MLPVTAICLHNSFASAMMHTMSLAVVKSVYCLKHITADDHVLYYYRISIVCLCPARSLPGIDPVVMPCRPIPERPELCLVSPDS